MTLGKAILLGALTGMVIGTLAGILFGRENHSDTRYHIKDMSEEYVQDLKSRWNEPTGDPAEMYGGMVHLTKKFTNTGKAKYEEPKTRVYNSFSDLRQGST